MTGAKRLLGAVLIVVLIVSAVPAPAAAVEATANDTPRAAEVGGNVSATFSLTDLYTAAPKTWRLRATTELDNVTWTVTAYGLDDRELATRSFTGRSLRTPVRASQNVSRLEVRVTGTAPPVENFTYRPREQFTLASLSRERNGNSRALIKNWSAGHYTAESRSARRTLQAARTAVQEDGNDELTEQVGFAVSAYRNENFELANAIATDAKQNAEETEYPIGLLSGLFLGGIVVALGTAGIRSYRDRRRDDRHWSDR